MTTTTDTTNEDSAVLDPEHVGDIHGALGTITHGDLAERPRRPHAFEHRREQEPLFRRTEAGRRPCGQHDRRDHAVAIRMLRISTTRVGCSWASPSLPIRCTTARPLVTRPRTP